MHAESALLYYSPATVEESIYICGILLKGISDTLNGGTVDMCTQIDANRTYFTRAYSMIFEEMEGFSDKVFWTMTDAAKGRTRLDWLCKAIPLLNRVDQNMNTLGDLSRKSDRRIEIEVAIFIFRCIRKDAIPLVCIAKELYAVSI